MFKVLQLLRTNQTIVCLYQICLYINLELGNRSMKMNDINLISVDRW